MDYFPLDPVGRVRAVAMSAYDYSRQYESRERLALLGEARTRIGASLELEGTADELAELLVPRFADVVSVDLFEAVLAAICPRLFPPGPFCCAEPRNGLHASRKGRVPALGRDAVAPGYLTGQQVRGDRKGRTARRRRSTGDAFADARDSGRAARLWSALADHGADPSPRHNSRSCLFPPPWRLA